MCNEIQPLTHQSDSAHLRRAPTRSEWRMLATIAAAAMAAACSDQPTSPPPAPSVSAAPLAGHAAAQPLRYEIRDLQPDLDAAGFDGSFSSAFDISNAGRIAGAATVPGGYQHAFLWVNGTATNVGTLGDDQLNSQAGGRAGSSELAILSEITTEDPLAENFCGFGTSLICRAGVWRDGAMTTLPTLGGNNAAALGVNSQGQIVGVAEDGILDNTCIPPQKSHFQAVFWERGTIHKLPPLPGDEVAMASRNNANGQVAGTSGLCSNTVYGGTGTGPHAVMWDHGTPTYLGNLGDPNVGFAAAINNQGDVFGAASYPDGTLHAFRWTRATGMQDLGVMSSDPADAQNTPFQANDRGQMVGASCDAPFGSCRGYLWQNNAYTDLNTLIPADSKLYIVLPFGINESGQIAGMAVNTETGEPHAFLATPIHGAVSASVVVAAQRAASPPALPVNLRKMLLRSRGIR